MIQQLHLKMAGNAELGDAQALVRVSCINPGTVSKCRRNRVTELEAAPNAYLDMEEASKKSLNCSKSFPFNY